MSDGRYQINEKDIESVIRYLKTIDPQNANRETAVLMLQILKDRVQIMGENNLESLKKIYEDLKLQKKLKIN